MKTLVGEHIYLRALEPEDLDIIYTTENNEALWNVGETVTPFSKYVLRGYLENAHKSVFEVGQLRLVVCDIETDSYVGLIDLYDFDVHNLRAGIGILIAAEEKRRKGYGTEALSLLISYCKIHLKLHQLYANIEESNTSSVNVFEKLDFKQIGLKKDWRRKPSIDGQEQYTNEYLYQLLF